MVDLAWLTARSAMNPSIAYVLEKRQEVSSFEAMGTGMGMGMGMDLRVVANVIAPMAYTSSLSSVRRHEAVNSARHVRYNSNGWLRASIIASLQWTFVALR